MMDSFELNKLIGALLAVIFVVFSVSIVSDSIFATHAPETPGYAIEVAEAETDVGGGVEETGPSVTDLLASADVSAGESAFRKCVACHTVEEGGANKVGPNLWDVVNRPIASHEGFKYSAGMRDFSEDGSKVWDYEHLSGFLQAPRSYVAGTAMAFAGIKRVQEEADLIAYLRSMSNDPAPLPVAASAEEEQPTEEAAPAEEAPADDVQPAEEAAPAEEAPAEATPAEEAPAEAAPAEEAPAEAAPAEEAPAEATPAEEAPAEETPAEEAPAEEKLPE